MRRAFVLIVLAAAMTSLPGEAVTAAETAATGKPGDFNGDGFGDLAVAVFSEDLGAVSNAGAVNVLYGSATGLSATGNQFWNQDVQGVAGDGAEQNDQFGRALAIGDFNADGFADLAVGVPGEGLGAETANGAVNVLYGSTRGLVAAGDQFWTQDSPGIEADAEPGDSFGSALAAGDLNGDGFADLAIGAPREDDGATLNTGALSVLYGSPTGLADDGSQYWEQGSSGIADGPEADDLFGNALAIGNFGLSFHADLAVGVPGESLEGPTTVAKAGAVNVLYGSDAGLTDSGNQFWHQDSTGIPDSAEEEDGFGSTLTAANFGVSSKADLAVGVEAEDVGTLFNAGAVHVLYGGASGLTATGTQFWTQDSPGILDDSESADAFGRFMTAANFGRSGQADLAIGVGAEDVGTVPNSGALNLLYGSRSGLTDVGNQFWSQDSPGVANAAEDFDFFSDGLASVDFGKSSQADLAIGSAGESIGTVGGAGSVNVLYGSTTGLTEAGDQFWHQDKTGILDQAESDDFFGFGLGPRR